MPLGRREAKSDPQSGVGEGHGAEGLSQSHGCTFLRAVGKIAFLTILIPVCAAILIQKIERGSDCNCGNSITNSKGPNVTRSSYSLVLLSSTQNLQTFFLVEVTVCILSLVLAESS